MKWLLKSRGRFTSEVQIRDREIEKFEEEMGIFTRTRVEKFNPKRLDLSLCVTLKNNCS